MWIFKRNNKNEDSQLKELPDYPLRPTAKLVVMLHKDGVLWSNPFIAPSFRLKYSDLLMISELQANPCADIAALSSKIASRTGVNLDEVELFLNRGRRTDRLRPQANATPETALPSAVLTPDEDTSWLYNSLISLELPLTLQLYRDKYQLVNHDGFLLVDLSAAELIALSQFVQPTRFADGFGKQSEVLIRDVVAEPRLREILALLDCAKLLAKTENLQSSNKALSAQSRAQSLLEHFEHHAAEQDSNESLREEKTGIHRPKVIPVWAEDTIPAALGLIMAYAKSYKDGDLDEFYDFRLDWVWNESRLERFASEPAIYLFSNYLWSHEKNISISEKVKALSPDSITIHGGPDAPKYEGDAKAYLEKFPHIDILVRAEGEASAADTLDKLREVIGNRNPDFSILEGVEGITYRHNGEIVRNPDRPRIMDLDTIPSPYLIGLFDAYKGIPRLHVTLETNRGCPYGCTFCDWGSATSTKIRKFDIDRVYGELEWCSEMQVESISQADANFGVFERDVAITEKVAALKQASGYPKAFGGSYAKNSTKYLQKIIKVLVDAEILTQGVLSLQTMDDSTLAAINRSNIKVEKYDQLAIEMRKANLQLTVDLMMGLPGSSLKTFTDDMQQCIDREVHARISHTVLLVNSPMNSPDYKEKHQITTRHELEPGTLSLIVSTKTFTEDDLKQMERMRQIFFLFENFGVLRLCSRFVRQQTDLCEMDFYLKLMSETEDQSQEHKWPLLNTLINSGSHLMSPIYSWKLLLDELRLFLIQNCGVTDDSALDAIMAAQHAILPAHGREYPYAVELPHDVVTWHSELIAAKSAVHPTDWQSIVPPLISFQPGRLEVNDVYGLVTKMLGCHFEMTANGATWDMQSGLARATSAQDSEPAWLSEDVAEAG